MLQVHWASVLACPMSTNLTITRSVSRWVLPAWTLLPKSNSLSWFHMAISRLTACHSLVRFHLCMPPKTHGLAKVKPCCQCSGQQHHRPNKTSVMASWVFLNSSLTLICTARLTCTTPSSVRTKLAASSWKPCMATGGLASPLTWSIQSPRKLVKTPSQQALRQSVCL